MIRQTPISTRTDTLVPTRRSSDLLAWHFWLPAVEPMPRLARITYNASAIFGGTVIVLQMARLLASGKPVLFSSLYQIVERIIWLLCFLSLIDSGANLV